MALDLDLKDHRVNELSVPRDMIATLPNGQKAKINQAQSDGGIAESKSVIADWLGIAPFDRYVVMRIDTSKDVINAIGGIDVVVKNSDALRGMGPNGPVNYDDNWDTCTSISSQACSISTASTRSRTHGSATIGAAIRAALCVNSKSCAPSWSA